MVYTTWCEKESLNKPLKKSKSHNEFNTAKPKITYNSMGERVMATSSLRNVLTGNVPSINVSGSCDRLRHGWKKQKPRVNTLESLRKFPRTLLKSIPVNFSKLIYRNIEFPTVWSPTDENWFDARRAIRIARTLIEMR